MVTIPIPQNWPFSFWTIYAIVHVFYALVIHSLQLRQVRGLAKHHSWDAISIPFVSVVFILRLIGGLPLRLLDLALWIPCSIFSPLIVGKITTPWRQILHHPGSTYLEGLECSHTKAPTADDHCVKLALESCRCGKLIVCRDHCDDICSECKTIIVREPMTFGVMVYKAVKAT